MCPLDGKQSTSDLLRLAAQASQKQVMLTEEEMRELIEILKERGQTELELGEEINYANVRLVRRVTGVVSVFFRS